jgi:transcriptional regulator with XRE-family HTH domain
MLSWMRKSRIENAFLAGIGAEIKRRRQGLGLSQGTLATKAGVHVNVVGRTERGIHNPTIMTLFAIAIALNASIVDLLRGDASIR